MEIDWASGTALHQACASFDLDLVEELVETCDVDARIQPGNFTALMLSCIAFSWALMVTPCDEDVVAILEVLLAAGADATLVDDQLSTALNHAVSSNCNGAARTLVDAAPCCLSRRDALGWQPLHYAVELGHGEALRALLDKRARHVADVNAPATPHAPSKADPWSAATGLTATHALCLRGRVGLLGLLLRDHGLDPNPPPSALGVTPLHCCAWQKRRNRRRRRRRGPRRCPPNDRAGAVVGDLLDGRFAVRVGGATIRAKPANLRLARPGVDPVAVDAIDGRPWTLGDYEADPDELWIKNLDMGELRRVAANLGLDAVDDRRLLETLVRGRWRRRPRTPPPPPPPKPEPEPPKPPAPPRPRLRFAPGDDVEAYVSGSYADGVVARVWYELTPPSSSRYGDRPPADAAVPYVVVLVPSGDSVVVDADDPSLLRPRMPKLRFKVKLAVGALTYVPTDDDNTVRLLRPDELATGSSVVVL
ncbi:hypothetical protein JL722_2263 [Aureococcus anophagefferens]|nr:hypothetical protein JL722_2263 [Aureococcus anophagefferens]